MAPIMALLGAVSKMPGSAHRRHCGQHWGPHLGQYGVTSAARSGCMQAPSSGSTLRC